MQATEQTALERTIELYDGAKILGWTWDGGLALIVWGDALTVAPPHSTTLGRWENHARALGDPSTVETLRSRFRHWSSVPPTDDERAVMADGIADELTAQAQTYPHGDDRREPLHRYAAEMASIAAKIRAGERYR